MQLFLLQVYFLQSLFLSVSVGTLEVSTVASWILIILFSEMLKVSKIISSKSTKNIVKENSGY